MSRNEDEVLLIVFKPFPLLLPPERYIDIKALMATLIVITREEVTRLVTRSKQEVLAMPVRCWRDKAYLYCNSYRFTNDLNQIK